MKRNYLHTVFTILMISIICLSCNQRETYYHFKEFKDINWSKNDTLIFEIDSSCIELNKPYNISFEIVNNSDYLYQNLWIFAQDNFQDNQSIAYEIEYPLADNQGNWNGAGFGSLYQLSVPYKQNIIFRQNKNLVLKLVHGMRDEPLLGIEKFGVKVISVN